MINQKILQYFVEKLITKKGSKYCNTKTFSVLIREFQIIYLSKRLRKRKIEKNCE